MSYTVTGTLTLHRGYHNGTQWVENTDSYDYPCEKSLANSHVVLSIRHDGPQDAPARLLAQTTIQGPSFPLHYEIRIPERTAQVNIFFFFRFGKKFFFDIAMLNC